MRSRSSLVPILLAPCLLAASAGQGGPQKHASDDGARAATDAPAPKPKKQVEYLTAWPAPANKDALLVEIEKLCKLRTPEMGVQARESLESAGAAAVPFLLERLGKEKDEAAAKRVREVLVSVTAAGQTRLLAKEFDNRFETTKTFALWRAAAFPDPQIRPAAEAAWKKIDKLGAKADPEQRYAAALCAASAGSLIGVDVLQETALKSWDRRGVELRAALEGVRGPEATKIVLAKLKDADQKQKVAVLRLLAGCGDKSALPAVKPFLDDDDNQLRVSAINACRGIVEGAPPLEQLPVFEAIETAKKWKEKV
jgi:HEAT repeat protein